MGDLMTGTYTYQALKDKYENFLVPAVKIKIGGSNIIGTAGFQLEKIEMDLSLHSPGSANFRLINCYDIKNGTFDSKVKNKIVLGTAIEIEFGYLSATTLVFKGYIASVGVDFDADETIAYEVTALDVRHLMMSEYHTVLHNVKNYSEAFEAVMKPYKKLCSLTVDTTSDKLEIPISQNGSDYDFIIKELIGKGKADREFFILAGKAYFRKPQSVSSPIMTLGIGNGLAAFQRSAYYLNQKIQVVGYDPEGQKDIKGEAAAKAADKQVAALSEPGSNVITDSGIHTEGEAKRYAKCIADRLKAKSQQGSAVCIGLPEIVPGRYMKLERIDADLNKDYYVTQVKHSMDENGFLTKFEFEGWK